MISMDESKILFDAFLNTQDNKNEETNHLCLISNEPLKNNYIKLECGHMFNYNELYNEVFDKSPEFTSYNDIKYFVYVFIRFAASSPRTINFFTFD